MLHVVISNFRILFTNLIGKASFMELVYLIGVTYGSTLASGVAVLGGVGVVLLVVASLAADVLPPDFLRSN